MSYAPLTQHEATNGAANGHLQAYLRRKTINKGSAGMKIIGGGCVKIV